MVFRLQQGFWKGKLLKIKGVQFEKLKIYFLKIMIIIVLFRGRFPQSAPTTKKIYLCILKI